MMQADWNPSGAGDIDPEVAAAAQPAERRYKQDEVVWDRKTKRYRLKDGGRFVAARCVEAPAVDPPESPVDDPATGAETTPTDDAPPPEQWSSDPPEGESDEEETEDEEPPLVEPPAVMHFRAPPADAARPPPGRDVSPIPVDPQRAVTTPQPTARPAATPVAATRAAIVNQAVSTLALAGEVTSGLRSVASAAASTLTALPFKVQALVKERPSVPSRANPARRVPVTVVRRPLSVSQPQPTAQAAMAPPPRAAVQGTGRGHGELPATNVRHVSPSRAGGDGRATQQAIEEAVAKKVAELTKTRARVVISRRAPGPKAAQAPLAQPTHTTVRMAMRSAELYAAFTEDLPLFTILWYLLCVHIRLLMWWKRAVVYFLRRHQRYLASVAITMIASMLDLQPLGLMLWLTDASFQRTWPGGMWGRYGHYILDATTRGELIRRDDGVMTTILALHDRLSHPSVRLAIDMTEMVAVKLGLPVKVAAAYHAVRLVAAVVVIVREVLFTHPIAVSLWQNLFAHSL